MAFRSNRYRRHALAPALAACLLAACAQAAGQATPLRVTARRRTRGQILGAAAEPREPAADALPGPRTGSSPRSTPARSAARVQARPRWSWPGSPWGRCCRWMATVWPGHPAALAAAGRRLRPGRARRGAQQQLRRARRGRLSSTPQRIPWVPARSPPPGARPARSGRRRSLAVAADCSEALRAAIPAAKAATQAIACPAPALGAFGERPVAPGRLGGAAARSTARQGCNPVLVFHPRLVAARGASADFDRRLMRHGRRLAAADDLGAAGRSGPTGASPRIRRLGQQRPMGHPALTENGPASGIAATGWIPPPTAFSSTGIPPALGYAVAAGRAIRSCSAGPGRPAPDSNDFRDWGDRPERRRRIYVYRNPDGGAWPNIKVVASFGSSRGWRNRQLVGGSSPRNGLFRRATRCQPMPMFDRGTGRSIRWWSPTGGRITTHPPSGSARRLRLKCPTWTASACTSAPPTPSTSTAARAQGGNWITVGARADFRFVPDRTHFDLYVKATTAGRC